MSLGDSHFSKRRYEKASIYCSAKKAKLFEPSEVSKPRHWFVENKRVAKLIGESDEIGKFFATESSV